MFFFFFLYVFFFNFLFFCSLLGPPSRSLFALRLFNSRQERAGAVRSPAGRAESSSMAVGAARGLTGPFLPSPFRPLSPDTRSRAHSERREPLGARCRPVGKEGPGRGAAGCGGSWGLWQQRLGQLNLREGEMGSVQTPPPGRISPVLRPQGAGGLVAAGW